MLRSLAILAVLTVSGGLAAAEPSLQVSIAVGQAAKRDVGYARGLQCDDTSIVAAEIATDTARDTNVVTFTGLVPGKTLCRAGLEVGRPAFVFTVEVTAKKKATSLPRR